MLIFFSLTQLAVVGKSSGSLVSVFLEHIHSPDEVHVELEEDGLDEVPHLSEDKTQSTLAHTSSLVL